MFKQLTLVADLHLVIIRTGVIHKAYWKKEQRKGMLHGYEKHARLCTKTLYKGIKTMIFFRLILGIFMLTAGSRLFWLFLGAVGFISGFDLAEKVMQSQPHDIIIIVALLAGLVGALLAVFLQKIAVLAGGLLAGGSLQ